MHVEVADRQRRLRIDRRRLRNLVRFVLASEGITEATISLAIVDDATIHRLNRDHLGHDYPTDVVTYPYSAPDEPLAGEVVVSADHAAAQAGRFGHSPREELWLYVIHGLLHLAGYDDRRALDAKRMSRRQRRLLEHWMSGGAPARRRRDHSPKPLTKSERGRGTDDP